MTSPAGSVHRERRIVELRIHGVSGTPPESMLRTGIDDQLTAADVEQVAGDDLTGFYRVRTAHHAADPDHALEAYNWGQLTSGTWRKSLWLLLVPFGLLNAAHFMLPKVGRGGAVGGRLLSRTAEALLRVLGVVMTAVFTLGVAAALIDLVGWQWTGLPSSAGHDGAARFADPRGILAAAVVVAALIPTAVLLFGGLRSPAAGEPVAPVPPFAEQSTLARTTGLVGPEFTVGYPTIVSLQRVHFAVIAGLLAHIAFSIYRQDGGATSELGRWLSRNGPNSCTVVLIGVTALALCFGNPHHVANKVRLALVRGASWLALAVAAPAWAVAGICVLTSRSIPPTGRGPLPGLPGLCNATMVVGLAAILLLALTGALLAAVSRRTKVPRPFRRYLLGMIGTIMAAIAVFLGVGLAAASVYGTRWVLLRTTATGTDLLPPLIVGRMAHAWGVTTVELLLIGLVLLILWAAQRTRFVRRVRIAHNVHPYADTDQQQTAAGYDGLVHPRDLTPSAIAGVATSWWLARIKYHLQWVLGALAIFGVLLGTLTAFALAHDNGVPIWRIFSANAATVCIDTGGPAASPLVGWTVSCTGYGGPFFAAAGSAVLLGFAAVLVYLGRRSVSDNSLRRSLNVVWDIIAFWPRAAHPLVPPPYTAKALDELRRRIYFHLARCAMPDWHRAAGCSCARSATPADQVVLAPHSQGSLLALAAIAGLRLEETATGAAGAALTEESPFRPILPAELGMVSYGSQLQFAYARAFPAYVNHALIARCVSMFSDGTVSDGTFSEGGRSRWINLLRETDPIGGQVFSDERDDTFHSRTLRTGFDPGQPKELDTRLPGDRSTGVRICGTLEWRLLDPVPTDGQTAKRWPILAHSDYFLDPAWAAVIAHVCTTSDVPR